MSYEIKIDPKKRAAGRFIGAVRKALVEAAIDEKKRSGISQQRVAECLGVNRSVINRMLNGSANLTLRSVAELAWALGLEPSFALKRRTPTGGDNKRVHPIPAAQRTITSSNDRHDPTVAAGLPAVTTSSTPTTIVVGNNA